MSGIKWIKITTDMFEDEKIDFIASLPEADAIIIIWIRILALAGKCNAGGYVMLTEKIPYTDEMLSQRFKKPLNTVKFALETFKKLDMISVDEDGGIFISNWEKHQNIDGMERVREQNRLRKQSERNRKKMLAPPSDEPVSRDVTGQSQSIHATDKEIELEIDIEKDIKNICVFDDFWSAYPKLRRLRKQDALKAWNHILKNKDSPADPNDVVKAAENYAAICTRKGTQAQYILHPPTFLNKERWRDYLKDEVIEHESGIHESGTGDQRHASRGNFSTGQRRISEEQFDSLGIGQ